MNRPSSASILAAFAEQVSRFGDRISLECGSQALTYCDLDRLSDRIAHSLIAKGVTSGSFVVLALDRSIELIATMLAVLKTGAAYVTLDADSPPDRLGWLSTIIEARLVICSEAKGSICKSIGLPYVSPIDLLLAGKDTRFSTVDIDGETPAYLMFTSGSTGNPKAVLIPHRGILRLVDDRNDYVPFGAQQRILHLAPPSFDASTFEIWAPLLNGGTCSIVPEGITSGTNLQKDIANHRITTLWLTASVFNMFVEEDPKIFSDLSYLIIGGEALSVRHVLKANAELPNVTLVNGYGPTECTTFSCTFTIPKQLPVDVDSIPIGHPLFETEVFVVDEFLRSVPQGFSGELLISGHGLAQCYYGDDEQTKERFFPWKDENGRLIRVYRTGDRVRLNHTGNLEFLGRTDRQVKISGHRIELDELERKLLEIPEVRQAAIELNRTDRGECLLIAHYSGTIDAKELRRVLENSVGKHAMPHHFVRLEKLPLSPSGKIERSGLRFEGYTTPPPSEPSAPLRKFIHNFGFTEKISRSADAPLNKQVTSAAPSNIELKKRVESGARSRFSDAIERAWMRAVGCEAVDNDTSFLEAGGSSLRALQLVSSIQRELAIEVPVIKVFEHSTLTRFVKYVESILQEEPTSLEAAVPQKYTSFEREPIAIVGMACRFPGADNLATFWQNLLAGRESITFFSQKDLSSYLDSSSRTNGEHSSAQHVAARGILSDVDLFDRSFFGVPPLEAAVLDPQHRLFLEQCWIALEDAGEVSHNQSRTAGVFAGMWNNTYFKEQVSKNTEVMASIDPLQAMLLNEKDYLATRVSQKLNLTGPSISVQTACSTSLVAVSQAVRSLQQGECNVALAGGVAITFPQRSQYEYKEGSILSSDGHCRPFDDTATGTVFSDGCGVVVLKRLVDAIRDRNQVYAVIRGCSVNNDGADRASFTAPGVSGQRAVVRAALHDAGVSPADVGFIEAHGTATKIGDPIEIEALKGIFNLSEGRELTCVVGSLKGNVGHLTIASGIAGLIKAAMAVKTGIIPGTVNFQKLNKAISFQDSPFLVSSEKTKWHASHSRRIAGVSSFGFGGSNAHVVIEAPPTELFHDQEATETRIPYPIILSARTILELNAAKKTLSTFLSSNQEISLRNLSHTLLFGRKHFSIRWASAVTSLKDLKAQLLKDVGEFSPGTPGELVSACQEWLRGEYPDFYPLTYATRGRIISLPTYPFTRERCWVDGDSEESSTTCVVPIEAHGIHTVTTDDLHSFVITIFEKASGIPFTDTDAETPFLELGLDSLLLTQIAIDLKKQLGVQITLGQLLDECSTFSRLEEHLAHFNPAPPSASLENAITKQHYESLSQQVVVNCSNSERAAPMQKVVTVHKPFGPAARISTTKGAPLPELLHAELRQFITAYNRRTATSKSSAAKAREILADPRAVSGFRPLMKEIVYPIVVDRSEGSKLWDVDGNEYVDFTCGFGSNFFGNRFPGVVDAVKRQLDLGFEIGPQSPLTEEVARLVLDFVKQERVAFCTTGSEAVLGAIRIARTVTGKNLIVTFTGGYHGIFDEVVVRDTRNGAAVPAAPGIMREAVSNVLVLPWGDPRAHDVILGRIDEIAAVIVEPVQSRNPNVQPVEFLKRLREITSEHEVALIFDEIVTGFRIHPGGAQAYFGIEADICTYGKVVGGGLPIGIIAGRRRFMDALDGGAWRYGDESFPEVGVTYFAGTFVRFPLALAATKAVLQHLREAGEELYAALNSRSTDFAEDLNNFLERVEAPLRLEQFCSIMKLTFITESQFSDLFYAWLRMKGVHIWDGRPCFLTLAHSDSDIRHIMTAIREVITEMQQAGFFPTSRKFAQTNMPPVRGARLGRDEDGNPAWFSPDPEDPSRFLRVGEIQ